MPVVFRVRFDSEDDHRTLDVLSGILDGGCQSKLVSPDIEHHITGSFFVIQVRRPKCSPNVRKRTPSSPFYDVHPSLKRFQGLWMFLPEALQRQFTNNPHVYIMYTPGWQVKWKMGRIRQKLYSLPMLASQAANPRTPKQDNITYPLSSTDNLVTPDINPGRPLTTGYCPPSTALRAVGFRAGGSGKRIRRTTPGPCGPVPWPPHEMSP
jgi:hypothetical protein